MSMNGETIDGASIGGAAALDEEAYQLWLRNPAADVAHLVEIDYHGNSAVYPNWITYTLKLSDIAMPGSGYRDLVKSLPSFQRQIGDRFTGTVSASVGSIELHNEDGALDLWHNLAVDGQEVRVYQGDPSWSVDRFRIMFKCVAEKFSASTMDTLTLQLRGIDYKSDQPIQTNLIPNTSTTAGANVPIPKGMGAVFNAEPVIVDAVNETRQCNDGVVTSVTAGRDGGVPFQTEQIAISAVVGNLISTATAHGFVAGTRVRSDIGSLPSVSLWSQVIWNGSIFCAIAYSSTVGAISADGIYWTSITVPSGNWVSVAWNGTVFCAIEQSTRRVITSPDGVTWTLRATAMPSAASWKSIAWNGTVFCAVSYGSTAAATSQDGITWTARTLPSAAGWVDLCWNGTVFCALSDATFTATSADGTTWTQGTIPSAAAFNALAWNGKVFCAIAAGYAVSATSTDGLVWAVGTMPSASNWFDIAWNGTVFCAVSGLGSTAAATSPDGITWTARTLPASANWQCVAWNGTVFCAIAYLASYATTSADGISWSAVAGTLPAPLALSTDYWVIADGLTTTSFKVSATRGGSAVNLTLTTSGGVLIGYHWTADLATGKIYLDQKPAGVFTVDFVAGSTDAATMIISALGATDVDPSSKTRFQTTCPQALGIYIKDRRNRIDVAQDIVNGIGAWYGYSREGLLQFGRVEATPAYANADLIEDDFVFGSLSIESLVPPEKLHRLGYRNNWTKQDGQLFAGVSADNRALYSNDYSVSQPIAGTDTGANGSFHALAVKPDVIPSLMALSSDAQTEAARLDAMYFGWGAIFTGEVGRIGTQFELGQVVRLTHSRFGLAGGVNMTVVSTEDKPSERTTVLKFFAALSTYAPGQL